MKKIEINVLEKKNSKEFILSLNINNEDIILIFYCNEIFTTISNSEKDNEILIRLINGNSFVYSKNLFQYSVDNTENFSEYIELENSVIDSIKPLLITQNFNDDSDIRKAFEMLGIVELINNLIEK